MIIRPLVLLAAMGGTVMGQVDLAFQDFKDHQQTDAYDTVFIDGQVTVRLQDGEIFISVCPQPVPFIIQPDPLIPCPLGTTGFIAQGDVGGVDEDGNVTGPDGIPDDGSFWSVAQIIPAGTVEPLRVDRFTVNAAPPSGLTKLLRANRGDINSVFSVEDASAVVWYDYINFPIQEYKVTLYFMERLYAVRGNQWVTLEGDVVTGRLDDPLPDLATVRPNFPFFPVDSTTPNPLYAADLPTGTDPLTTPMLRENTVVTPGQDFRFTQTDNRRLAEELERQYFDIPWGSYLFSTPSLNDPEQERLFGVTLLVSPDVYPGRGQVPKGWRIANEDHHWNGDRLEVDPREFYEFIWDGIDFQNTVASDELYLGFRADQYPVPGGSFATIDDTPDPDLVPNPGAPLENVLVFPPYQFDTPIGDRELFKLGVYDNMYELGPFFFQPGESVIAELDWRRNLEGGNATRDVSRRILRWNISFIDTFTGFAFYSRGPIVEDGFPFGTPSSRRRPMLDYDGDGFSNLIEYATQADLADATVMPVITTTAGTAVGACSASVPKRSHVGSSLTYEFEFSTDGVVWDVIKPGGIWDITETADELTVVNNTDLPAGAMCLFRIRVTMNR